MEAGAARIADRDAAEVAARGAFGGIERALEVGERGAGVVKKSAAGVGQFHAARLAAKQLHADLALDRFDLPAERRLLRAKPLGGARNVSFLGDRNEDPQV